MSSKLAISGGRKVREKPFVTVPRIGEEEKKHVIDVLDKGILSGFVAGPGEAFYGGNKVKELEGKFRDYFNVKQAIAVNSATAGLHAAIAAVGIGPGDEVIVTPYTMSASATAILMQNGIPVFADIDEKTFCVDPCEVEKKITSRTKAIIAVHLFGQSADMDKIMGIARKHKLFVIEDCAQAPAAKYKEKYIGTIGDIGIFSLNQHKIITCGEGGVAVTNNDELALNIRLVRNHGEVIIDKMEFKNQPVILGWNYRMTELEAAVSIGQFSRLDALTEERRHLAEYLTSKIKGIEGIVPPFAPDCNEHVYFVYPVKLDANKLKIKRDVFAAALKAEGIPCATGYVRPIYLEPTYRNLKGYGNAGCPYKCPFYDGEISYNSGDCPVCERMHFNELIVLPVCRSPQTERDMDDVAEAVIKIANNIDEIKEKTEI
ncbi:MAG: DegT/DnrJ/EryC1/StrS family aminotransferase [bacterium]|nr:DegT/DnrJ/EryC1/StrS family aminotransferase [bacterium]